jgi:large subunit ribosomal protein L19
MNKLLQEFEAEQTTRQLPDFGPGDTVVVNVKVKEGNRERVQAYEGVVIAKKNAASTPPSPCARSRTASASSACSRPTARDRLGAGQAPRRRAQGKLYYLRDLQGKKARIKEDLAARSAG